MASKALVVSSALLVACSGSPEPTPKPAAPQDPAADVVVERVRIFQGRVGGGGKTTHRPDGSLAYSYQHVENGRGPAIEGTAKIASDGTLEAFEARGKRMMGGAIDERFSVKDGVARWKSRIESGEKTLDGPAFYVPNAPWPESTKLLYDALQKSGGELALLPAGRAVLERVGEATVDGKRLVAWQISGLGFLPTPLWTTGDGEFVGTVSDYTAYVEKRWQPSIAALIKEQKRYTQRRDAELARELVVRPPAEGIAIVGAKVLDVSRGRWREGQTVLIKDGKITRIASAKKTRVPKGAQVIDASGKALIPGLWDMHAHLGPPAGVLNLASGVTTVRDLANDPDYIDDARARFDGNEAIGPHVFRSGFIEGRGPNSASSKIKAETEEEAIAAVEFYAKRNYEGIKIYNSMKAELVPILTKLAHERGMRVSGHVPVFMRAEDVVRAGYDEIQHINMLFLNFLVKPDTDTRTLKRFTLVGDEGPDLDLDSAPVRDFLALLKQKEIVVDPTATVFEWAFTSSPGEITPGLAPMASRLPVQSRRWLLAGGLADGAGADKAERYRAAFKHMLEMIRRLHAAKIRIVAGTDFVTGLALHRELELYVAAGIPAADVLRLATLGSAEIMKAEKQTGSIDVGKTADLVVIDGDPLKNIADVGKTVTVIKAGVIFDSAKLYRAVGVAPWTDAKP